MDEGFSGYRDIGERGFIRWCLGYGMESIIECFLTIPGERLYRPLGTLPPAVWIFGHIALNEEGLMRGFARGISERTCPYPTRLFDGWEMPTEADLRGAGIERERLAQYWRGVRVGTLAFLDSLGEGQLAVRAPVSTLRDDDPNRDNPLRELFIMAIQHQYLHWGHLDSISRLAPP